MERSITTTITQATIYTDRALVTRSATIDLTGTEQVLCVDGLPITMVADSLRVQGRGSSPVKILGVNLEQQRQAEPTTASIADLVAHLEDVDQHLRDLQAHLNAAQIQLEFVGKLPLKLESSLGRGRHHLNLQETLGQIDLVSAKYIEYAGAIEDYLGQQRLLNQQRADLQAQLDRYQNPHPQDSYQLQVAIEHTGASQFQLEVSYLVLQVSWQPSYDLRVNSDSKKLELTYLASVSQRSGEAWENIALTLSTAQPGLGNLPPRLDPWYVDVQNIWSNAAPADMVLGAAAPMARHAPAAASGELTGYLDPIAAETINAQRAEYGGVVTFKVAGRGKIPPDGTAYKTTLHREEIPLELIHIAMPSQVSFVYLQAKITNPDPGVTLLPGKANIFRDGMFVGVSDLGHVAPSQEFKLNLGIDDRVKINRELTDRHGDKKFLGGNRRTLWGYRIQIENLHHHPVTLELSERIPHSRSEKVRVKLVHTEPEIILGELGLLEWMLPLAPRHKMAVQYQFTIEHPEDVLIDGFRP
jgi:uncharacterized protein (TIGR02231 family)